jgi:very-short-patch-repair endonuclease
MSNNAPFPLEGGRAGDGGDSHAGPALRTKIARIKPGGVARAQRLRKVQPFAERKLWAALRALKMNFRRQVPIGPYVVDFAHLASKLVIEVDGYWHGVTDRLKRDKTRDAWLIAEGFRVLRFTDDRVKGDTFAVADEVAAAAAVTPIPDPSPLKGEGK